MNNFYTSQIKATTILCVRKDKTIAMGGDGQVTLGQSIMKNNANKIRKLYNNKVISGFAGAVADAFTLHEKIEEKLKQYHGDLIKSCVELTKEWRSDKVLRRLEATLLLADKEKILLVSGNGEVIEPEDQVIAIGSGGDYARSAALALHVNTKLSAKDIVEKSLAIAGKICIYTNLFFNIEEIKI
jgi:ATP-dependent HslUV protease subunit HslV